MPTNTDLMNAARDWMGVRWLHQGRNRAGIDCAGLLVVTTAELGIPIPDLSGYRRSPQKGKFLEHLLEHTDAPPQTEPAPGYIGLFRESSQPCHIGIFGEIDGQITLIHAYAGTGKVMEEPFTHGWPDRLIALRVAKGIE